VHPRSRWAPTGRFGAGASYRYGASYTPLSDGKTLTPGGEIRARFGIEGPFEEGSISAAPSSTRRPATTGSRAGRRAPSGTGSLRTRDEPAARPVQLSLYGWEMRRLRARASTLPVPRGNVLALGARLERPLNPKPRSFPSSNSVTTDRSGGQDGAAGLSLPDRQ